MKQLILYDLDGTLVDTREDIVRAANHMCREMGAGELSFEQVCAFVGWGLRDLVAKCLGTADLKRVEKGAKIFRAYYQDHLLDTSRLYPGAVEVLDYFKDRKQAVLTNKPNPFSRIMLERLGVAGYFVEIVAGNSNYPQKPDPAAVLAIMKRESVEPGRALFVGDSIIDLETGRNAGVETAILTHGFMAEKDLIPARPDWLVSDFEAFLQCAKKEGW
ncbi:MAG: HAD-IA family hydrolase [Candidatus Omnitrophota bacterium]|jgi:phosphoglycolate phosphatase